jgi:hypothetical protein
MEGSIAGYEWDINGDGIIEATTATPIFEYAYPAAFEGVMQVRLRDTADGLSSASAKVHIGQTPAVSTAPAAPTQVLATANPTSADGSEVQVSWSTATRPP